VAGEDAGPVVPGGDEREEFLYAVETARALHDPATEWDAFRDTLWQHLSRVFGLEAAGGWPSELPDPAAGPGGDAREVAAWFGETLHDQRSGVRPRS
jgi:hypothetical protein